MQGLLSALAGEIAAIMESEHCDKDTAGIPKIMEEAAVLRGLVADLERVAKPIEKRLGSLKPKIKQYIEDEGGESAFGYTFELRSSTRIKVDGWMADRVKAGEPVPGLSANTTKALYITPTKEE